MRIPKKILEWLTKSTLPGPLYDLNRRELVEALLVS